MSIEAAARYEAWYRTPRGAWISDAEFRLLVSLLRPRSGETLLDVGCGTGHFTRRFAREAGVHVTGVDPDPNWLAYARAQAQEGECFVVGRAERLPFADRSFDRTTCITALCFIADQRNALREMIRVTRHRLVLGLLNRNSLLYLRRGRGGGAGGYRGAHWHTAREVRSLLQGLSVKEVELRSAIHLPGGGRLARRAETLVPGQWLTGGFLAVAADIQH